MGMTERPIVLQGTGVRKYFPVHTGFGKPKKYVKAVDGVDITIHEGEIYGLVGETGCGKSTLGRTLIRLTDPTDGNISILGKDITKLNDKQMTDMRQKIQMVFQDPYTSLDPKQKVGDILMETLEIHGIGSKKDRLDIAMEIMGKVGLRPEHFYRYPHEFSGGQRQRVGLARALILNSKVIVCDEPVSALDVSIQAQIINLLQDLREKDRWDLPFCLLHTISQRSQIHFRPDWCYVSWSSDGGGRNRRIICQSAASICPGIIIGSTQPGSPCQKGESGSPG